MNKVIFPNTSDYREPAEATVFLAGSIEMGKADHWQNRLIEALEGTRITFFNPRRLDWDSSWKQTRDDPQFSFQVNWELDHLEKADMIALYLAPGTVSPISLLELGLYMGSGKLIICCPPGFERKGNVDITAEKYDVVVHEDFESFMESIRATAAVLSP